MLNCLPVAFFSTGIFDKLSAQMIAFETAKLKRPKSDQDRIKRDLNELERKQQNIIQQITDRAVEGRPRLLALDDTLDKLENDRLSLMKMIAEFDTSEPDMLAKIEDLRRRHNPEQTAAWMCNLTTMAGRNGNEDAKRRLMPIVRRLVQTVVIDKTPGHPGPLAGAWTDRRHLRADGCVLDLMEQQFIAAVQNDLLARIASGEIDREAKRKKLLAGYGEELLTVYRDFVDFGYGLVAGA